MVSGTTQIQFYPGLGDLKLWPSFNPMKTDPNTRTLPQSYCRAKAPKHFMLSNTNLLVSLTMRTIHQLGSQLIMLVGTEPYLNQRLRLNFKKTNEFTLLSRIQWIRRIQAESIAGSGSHISCPRSLRTIPWPTRSSN